MKELLIWLSIITFVQLLLLGVGNGLFVEGVKENASPAKLVFLVVTLIGLTGVAIGLYAKVFSGLRNKQ